MPHILTIFYILSTKALTGKWWNDAGIIEILFKNQHIYYHVAIDKNDIEKSNITFRGHGQLRPTKLACTYEREIGQYVFEMEPNELNENVSLKIILNTDRGTIRFESEMVKKQYKATAKNKVFGTIPIKHIPVPNNP